MAEYHSASHRIVSVFSLMSVSLMLYVSVLIELAVGGIFPPNYSLRVLNLLKQFS